MERRALLAGLGGAAIGGAAQAQIWNPDRPIRLIVGFAAGGSTDTTARVVAQAIGGDLGQSVLVENRTGAGGNIGSEFVARSAPDGYTLVMASMGTHATNQTLFRSLPFHVQRDFSAVSLVALSTCLLVVRPDLPVHDVRELIAAAKARPNTISGGTGGGGSSQHFAMVMFEHTAGVRFNQIAYRGGAPAMSDLVGGRIDLIFAPVVEAIEQVRAGQIRAIAITRAERSPQFPQVPAAAEQLPGYAFNSWLGVFAPAGTPAPVIARLSGAIQAAMRRPEVRDRMQQLGYDPVGSTAEDFSTFQAAEVPRLAELVRLSGATAD